MKTLHASLIDHQLTLLQKERFIPLFPLSDLRLPGQLCFQLTNQTGLLVRLFLPGLLLSNSLLLFLIQTSNTVTGTDGHGMLRLQCFQLFLSFLLLTLQVGQASRDLRILILQLLTIRQVLHHLVHAGVQLTHFPIHLGQLLCHRRLQLIIHAQAQKIAQDVHPLRRIGGQEQTVLVLHDENTGFERQGIHAKHGLDLILRIPDAVLRDIRPDIIFLLLQLQRRRTCLPTAARYAEQIIAQSEGKPDRTRLHRRIIPDPACQIAFPRQFIQSIYHSIHKQAALADTVLAVHSAELNRTIIKRCICIIAIVMHLDFDRLKQALHLTLHLHVLNILHHRYSQLTQPLRRLIIHALGIQIHSQVCHRRLAAQRDRLTDRSLNIHRGDFLHPERTGLHQLPFNHGCLQSLIMRICAGIPHTDDLTLDICQRRHVQLTFDYSCDLSIVQLDRAHLPAVHFHENRLYRQTRLDLMHVKAAHLTLIVEIQPGHRTAVKTAGIFQLLRLMNMTETHQIKRCCRQGTQADNRLGLREKGRLTRLGLRMLDRIMADQNPGRTVLRTDRVQLANGLVDPLRVILPFRFALRRLTEKQAAMKSRQRRQINLLAIPGCHVKQTVIHGKHQILLALKRRLQRLELLVAVMVRRAAQHEHRGRLQHTSQKMNHHSLLPQTAVRPHLRLMKEISGDNNQIRLLDRCLLRQRHKACLQVLETSIFPIEIRTGKSSQMQVRNVHNLHTDNPPLLLRLRYDKFSHSLL